MSRGTNRFRRIHYQRVPLGKRLRFTAIILATTLTACATPTPFQPQVDGYGYGDQRLAGNHYRVWFAGNTATPRQTAENYLLYRAAELTLETGHRWFRVVDQETEVETRYLFTGTAFPNAPVAPFSYGYRPIGPTFFEATSRPVSQYEAFAVVTVHRGERPANDDRAYDAAAVLDALGPTIIRPAAPSR